MACEAAQRLELVDTSWFIARVGTADIQPDARARVSFRIQEVQVDLECGSISGYMVHDTDGAALGMLGDTDLSKVCSGQTTSLERTQLEALRDVRSWRIETSDRIVLEGGPEVVLERVPEP
jgi:heat shock protein HslJ